MTDAPDLQRLDPSGVVAGQGTSLRSPSDAWDPDSIGRESTLAPKSLGLAGALLVASLSSPVEHPEHWWEPYFPLASSVSDEQAGALMGCPEAAPRFMPRTAELLADIQLWWGLTKSQLAEVCGVSRQTVYDWYAGKFEAERDNARRLGRLYGLAHSLETEGHRALSIKVVERALKGGGSLLDLLRAQTLDEAAIRAVFSDLDVATAERRSRNAAASMARLGWREPSEEERDRALEENFDSLVDG